MQVRVLMVTFSTHGHLNPTLRLAKRLVSKGLHVTVATTEAARKHLMLNPTATRITESTVQFVFFPDGLSDDFDRIKYVGAFIESLQKVGSKNLSSIINNLSNNDKKKILHHHQSLYAMGPRCCSRAQNPLCSALDPSLRCLLHLLSLL